MEASWPPDLLDRRLLVFEYRAQGRTMRQVHSTLRDEHGYTGGLRQLWVDWKAIRDLMATISAPMVTEVRDRCTARLETLYNLTMGQISRDQQGDGRISHGLIETGRRLIALQAELYGAIDRRGVLAITNAGLTPLEAYERTHGSGNGSNGGPFTPADR